MHAPPELDLELAQLRAHALCDRLPLEQEPPLLRLRADMRETKEVERFRLPEFPLGPVRGREAPELDQPRFLGVQLEGELREALTKLPKEPLSVRSMLETNDEVVGISDDDDVA